MKIELLSQWKLEAEFRKKYSWNFILFERIYTLYCITLLYIMSPCCILHSVIPLLYILRNCAKVHAMQCKWGGLGARLVSLVDKLKLAPLLPVVMHHNTPNISPGPCRGKRRICTKKSSLQFKSSNNFTLWSKMKI